MAGCPLPRQRVLDLEAEVLPGATEAVSLRRLVVIALSVVGAVLLAIVLYLAFADLGRHKGQIEAFVTKQIGRPFAIDGALELKVLPSVSLLAERVRVGNAEWGSKPQMLEIGRLSTHIGLWSLISGPVDVRSFELSDVSVLLEKNRKGEGNWAFGSGGTSDEATPPDSGVTEVPAVIQHAKLSNVEVTYREPGTPDRVALLETLTIEPGTDGLLALSGTGRLDKYNTTVAGHLGPIDALVSGRNIRMAIQAAIEKLRLDINGSIGRLDPLDGADLSLKLEHPDLGKMLENLRMPVVSNGHAERRRPAEGRRQADPARSRCEARRHHGQGERNARNSRPPRLGSAIRSLGR